MKCERPFHLLNEIHFLNEKDRPQRLDAIFIFFQLRTCFVQNFTLSVMRGHMDMVQAQAPRWRMRDAIVIPGRVTSQVGGMRTKRVRTSIPLFRYQTDCPTAQHVIHRIYSEHPNSSDNYRVAVSGAGFRVGTSMRQCFQHEHVWRSSGQYSLVLHREL